MRSVLCECAWVASRKRNTRIASRHWRLVKRMGQKKAIMATAHLLLIIAYHILKDLKPYEELGVDYYKAKQHDPVKLMIKKLSQAGYTVVAAS